MVNGNMRRSRRRSRKSRTSSRRRLQAKGFGSLAAATAAANIARQAYKYYGANRTNTTNSTNTTNPTNTTAGTRKRKGHRPTRTRVTRRKDNDGTGPYQQWSQRYAQATFGRMTLNKLINRETLIMYNQRFTRFNQGRGAEWLAQTTDTTNAVRTLPLVMWDLTGTVNHVDGSILKAPAAFQLAKSTVASTDGNIVWRPVSGLTMDGANSITTWDVEKVEHGVNAPASYPGASSVLEWASIELELWGQQQHHTKWTIEVCQFNEDVTPDINLPATSTGGPYEMYWDSMIKSYAYSPLYSGSINGFNSPKRKVLRRYNVDIDPTSTTESNADPHVKTFKMYFKFNRRCNYDWSKSGGNGQTIGQAGNQFDDIDAPTEIQANQLTVHPNARIYLMLRATDFNPKASFAAQTVANTPSYSWKIRTKHQLVN